MATDLLAGENLAGQNLLSIVSRGSAIVAELLRLSDHIPPVFYLADKADQAKYGAILHDFSYLRNIELHENRISSDVDLVDLDEEFRESHMELLVRFYRLFESIYKYVKDLTRYLADVEEGVYIQLRLEDLLASDIGKQLLAESFFLYGLMLTLMDNRIEGPVRERMLICYYRYKGSSDTHSAVCNLCRATGYIPTSQKRPPKYPEEYFARLTPPLDVVKMVVSRLRSDDIYKQMKEWPNPEHRTTALANQAAILYIVLFFVPDTLHNQQAAMREIVDKHFSDNWVISFYMGFVVDLSIMWEPYKAAIVALRNTLDSKHVKEIHEAQVQQIMKNQEQLGDLLTEGVLTEESLLDNSHKIVGCLRECNASLRWAMLHRNCRNKKLRDTVCASLQPDRILLLLLHTAQLEFRVTELYKMLLGAKEERWARARLECAQRVSELAHFFSGEQVLTRNMKDDKLQQWFLNLSSEVSSLDAGDATLAGRKMQQLLSAMEDVEQFHQIEGNAHVKHFLGDARGFLRQMVRIVNVREQMLATLAAVGDLSYAFDIITDYIPLMHALVKKDPFSVLLLRATFLKLASVLELPLVRINQASSPDLESVAEYYSSQLVAFVRRVMDVVPTNMFLILNDIIAVQTRSMRVLPARLERAELREYAQMEQRYRLARSTHQVSVFTEGVLAMEKTLMGIIEVDPKKLLQDGIRKELVRQISMALHGSLMVGSGKADDGLEQKLLALHKTLEGFRVSFEYISDYVSIYGLKIWHEELSRIINFNVEQECNVFQRKKTYEWESQFQSEAIPIPLYPPADEHSRTWIGRLVRELLLQTDRYTTTFFDSQSGWLDAAGRELVATRTFSLLHRSIGTAGLRGVDKTLGFVIVRDLNDLFRFYKRQVIGGLTVLLEHMQAELNPTSTLPALADKMYKVALERTAKLWPWFAEGLSRIGQTQLLRRQVAAELNFACKLDSATLSGAIEVMNEAVLNDIAAHYRDPEKHPYPAEEKMLLPLLTPYLDTLGMTCPMLKVYVAAENLEGMACIMSLFVISQIALYKYDQKVGLLMPVGRSGAADSTTMVIGVLTLLKQFHLSVTHKFIAFLAQYVRCQVVLAAKDVKSNQLPPQAINILVFLEELCKYGHLKRSLIHQHLPPYVLDVFAHST